MRAFYTLYLAVTLFYFVSSCDETQYLKDGRCCKMCGPGKRMLLSDNCEDPRCQDCLDGEYQSGYTSDTKCDRQPICDINVNFLPQTNPSKTSLSKCLCKAGHFCTEDDDCSICRKHTVCKAGEQIAKMGTPVSDTVCEMCTNGTFSIGDGATNCQKWTICESGFKEQTPGSLTSDRICDKATPSNRGAVLTAVIITLLIVVAAILVGIFGCRRAATPTNYKQSLERETDAIVEIDQRFNHQPQENVYDRFSDDAGAISTTENGNCLAQEDGKHSICPSTETGLL